MLKEYTINEVGSYGCIYKLISPSGKCYIGQSWHIKNRLSKYKTINMSKHQIKLYNALNKYGFINFTFEILDLCETQNEMDNKEIFYIEIYDSIKTGYNVRSGGNGGGKLSEETKLKLRNINLGRKHSQKTKLKMHKNRKGHKHSEETKNKLKKYAFTKENSKYYMDIRREKRRLYLLNNPIPPKIKKERVSRKGCKLSEETKLKMSLAKKGKLLSESEKEKRKIRQNKNFRKYCKYLYKIENPSGQIYYIKSLNRFVKYLNTTINIVKKLPWKFKILENIKENEILYEEFYKNYNYDF
jgi:group I intron endonuclease